MGFIDNIIKNLMEKYWKGSEVICETIEFKKIDDPDHPILMKGIDCVGKAGPIKIGVPKAYTKTKKINNRLDEGL